MQDLADKITQLRELLLESHKFPSDVAEQRPHQNEEHRNGGKEKTGSEDDYRAEKDQREPRHERDTSRAKVDNLVGRVMVPIVSLEFHVPSVPHPIGNNHGDRSFQEVSE